MTIKNDKIFLLSIEEYKRYKNAIPHINAWWWLRSPGCDSDYAAYVNHVGSVSCVDSDILDDTNGIRPALYLKYGTFKIGETINRYNFPWIVIDNNLAIAEVPIAFDKFDDKSNNYEISHVRRFLLYWIEKRS